MRLIKTRYGYRKPYFWETTLFKCISTAAVVGILAALLFIKVVIL